MEKSVAITLSMWDGLRMEYQGNIIHIPDIQLANKVISELHKMITTPKVIDVIVDKS
jgi:hypothetical protein